MTFAWPEMLWLLLAAPAMVGLYVWSLRRRRKAAIRYADLGLVKAALGKRQRFRRHIPPLMFLVGMVAAIFAISRPSAIVTLPSDARTIVLAMDVSLSMRATDVEPNRIIAAQSAARAFIEGLPRDIRAAIVTFAGTAAVVQPPTQNHEDLLAAIDRFELQRN